MRAVVGDALIGIDSLSLKDVERPVLIDGAVRIAVRAAGVSFANLLVAKGQHQNRPSLPYTPGTEIAGEVIEVSSAAADAFKPGDRVCAGLHPAALQTRPWSRRKTSYKFRMNCLSSRRRTSRQSMRPPMLH